MERKESGILNEGAKKGLVRKQALGKLSEIHKDYIN